MSKDVAVIPEELAGFTDLAVRSENLKGILADNIGDAVIRPFDLDRITIPTGATGYWMVPGLSKSKPTEELAGIILAWRTPRAYWSKKMGEGTKGPPDCKSDDGKIGVGNPGGPCKTCPYAQYGSKDDGVGQACKHSTLVFLLRPGALLPVVVALGPTSSSVFGKYRMRLTNEQIPYWQLVTKMKLDKAVSSGGVDYSRVVLEAGARLPAEMVETIREYKSSIDTYLTADAVEEIIDGDLA